MISTINLATKLSILCRILTGTAVALLVLLYMKFCYFEGSMTVTAVEMLSVPEQRQAGELRKNSTEIPRQGPFNSKNPSTRTNSYLPKLQPFHVLLNAYHRGGSSYTGRLLSLHDDTFYWFEPLQTTIRERYYTKNGSICSLISPGCEGLDNHDFKSLNSSLEFLVDLYSCDLDKHFNRFCDNLMKSVAFQADAAYRRCRVSGDQQKCYLAYAKSCVKAKNIVTKIVRLDIHHTKVLLQKYPMLKVLQLMRDPRGIVNCRLSHTLWYPISDQSKDRKKIEDNVKILCSKMRSDMEGARQLAREFPNRVRIIQYEDIVRGQEKQDALYRYLGAAVLKGNNHIPQLGGKNHTLGLYSFRNQLHRRTLDIVQGHCSDIIEMLGLRVFSSYDEMRNMSVQVEMRKEFPFSI